MRLGVIRKTETDRVDADVCFYRWLTEDDHLVDASPTITPDVPDGVEIDAYEIYGSIVKIWLSGGQVGKSYHLSVVASTKDGRIKEACLQVHVTGC